MAQTRVELIQEISANMTLIRQTVFNQRSPLPDTCEISPTQGMLLHTVATHGVLSIKEIAEILQVSSSAVTQMVDSLVKSGYLQRKVNSKDRRTMIISLSDKGQFQLEAFEKFHLENIGKVLQPLNDRDLQLFLELLLKLI